MTLIDPKTIADLRAAKANATPGPWRQDITGDVIASNGESAGVTPEDCALMVLLRNHASALLAAAERYGELERKLDRTIKVVGLCEACEGSGIGEPDYVEHQAIPTACDKCSGGGSDAFFKGKEHERGYIASMLGVSVETLDAARGSLTPLEDALKRADTLAAKLAETERERDEMRKALQRIVEIANVYYATLTMDCARVAMDALTAAKVPR